MPRVNLSTVIFYRGDKDTHRPVEDEIELLGVDKLFFGLEFPSNGMTFLYGHRNPATSFFLEVAAKANKDAAIVDVQIEIDKWLRQKVDFSDSPESGLKSTRFLSIARAKREIVNTVSELMKDRLGDAKFRQDNWLKEGTEHPYLFGDVIKLPEFQHLAAIAYTVKTAEVGEVQVATLFDLSAIVEVNGGPMLVGKQFVLD